MAIEYHGIALIAPTVGTFFTTDPTIWGHDVIVTATVGPAFIGGANGGTVMAVLATGRPFKFGGTDSVGGEAIQLSQYIAIAAAGDIHISYATRA